MVYQWYTLLPSGKIKLLTSAGFPPIKLRFASCFNITYHTEHCKKERCTAAGQYIERDGLEGAWRPSRRPFGDYIGRYYVIARVEGKSLKKIKWRMVIRTVALAVTITTTTAKTLQFFLRYIKRFVLYVISVHLVWMKPLN